MMQEEKITESAVQSDDDPTTDDDPPSTDEDFAEMEFMKRLQDYTTRNAFVERVDSYLHECCFQVDDTLEEGEFSHEEYASFQGFSKLIESELSSFIADENLESEAAFYAKCKSILGRGSFEAEYLTDLQVAGRMLDVTLRYSTVEGELDDGSNIPAMPADKIGLGLAMSFDALRVSVDVENAADQDDTATGELKTDGYTNVDVSASYQPPQYEGLTIIASVRNATDEEIRQHASPLKDRLPEPGQDFRLTARYKF